MYIRTYVGDVKCIRKEAAEEGGEEWSNEETIFKRAKTRGPEVLRFFFSLGDFFGGRNECREWDRARPGYTAVIGLLDEIDGLTALSASERSLRQSPFI